jgi:hypothetical protein
VSAQREGPHAPGRAGGTRSTYTALTPRDWGLPVPDVAGRDRVAARLGITFDEVEERCGRAVDEFVSGTYDEEAGAARHYYRADTREWSEIDSGVFLIALNFLARGDETADVALLERARRCYRWGYEHRTERHPMFTWQGGVRDEFKPHELYVKYTADALTTCAVLYQRTGEEELLFHATQFHAFLKRARQAGFAYKYDTATYRWTSYGFSWNGFGGPVNAYLQLAEATGQERYLGEAELWGRHGLDQQADDGAFYLLDGVFWNSDLAPLELRALVFLYETTGDPDFLESATRFAGWLLKHQRPDGSWPIGIDRDGEVCAPNVGPGDMPNIALSLIRLHMHRPEAAYLDAAVSAVRYGLSMQAVGPGKYPDYLADPHVGHGFWSWDPPFDWSLSGDQSVHHIRGARMLAHYLGRAAP